MMGWSPTGRGTDRAVTVTVASMAGLLADLEARLTRGEGFAVATLNLDHVVKLTRDPAFRAAYLAQSHVTADGNPVVWLSRLAGQRVELVPGSDLIGPVFALAARYALPVAFLGSTAETLERAREVVEDGYPGLRVVAALAPPMGFDPDDAAADEMIEELRRSGARICMVALGAPKQERFAARAAPRLPGTGFLSIGASLDFVAGRQRRAPRWVRRIASEWLWRMLSDPARLGRRYLDCLLILPGLTRRALCQRLRRGG
ncbi:WecB/TagA/CpsF family glycosyltransferase [Rhodovulum sulfidophilum]|uniref:WecB/TagA/CpsF family glycosyltransferase n=1 Tax=Rhodovulum sulfidophilum TaxID=35806 RepID=UPI0019219063|nr:WecB/TagA/CpsF family glycosyltransferase [Rhodovulum sulfidophilum]MBL3594265.1 WecB/TagA/CpsF family glycosyltransferase [Rhodovulum sulfidophilum]